MYTDNLDFVDMVIDKNIRVRLVLSINCVFRNVSVENLHKVYVSVLYNFKRSIENIGVVFK